MKIDTGAESVRTDAVPGVYFSSVIRGAWVDSFNLTQQIVGLSGRREMTVAVQTMCKSFEERLNEQIANYRKTIFTKDDQVRFDEFEVRHQLYNKEMTNVLDLYQRKEYDQAVLALEQKLTPAWINGRKQLNGLLENNHSLAEQSTLAISDAVTAAKISMGVSLLVAIIAAGLCGLLLMRAIMAPMNRIVDILEVMRTGDLSSRLNLDRKDEFGAVETGFNDMMTELTSLVSQAQRSSVQVTTSVTEIAATSKQQQATVKW
jgi:methyl-accepting chemotaxis protein WspA